MPDGLDKNAERADALIATMTSFTESVKQLNARADRQERRADKSDRRDKIIAFSLVLDFLLTIGLAISATESHSASEQAKKATSVAADSLRTQKLTCITGNESRRLQRELWNYVLEFSANTQTQTDIEKQRTADFKTYVNSTYADKNCDDLKSTVPLAPVVTPTP